MGKEMDVAKGVGMSERQFAMITGYRFGLDVSHYQTSLAIANEIQDDKVMWTGYKAKVVKETLKKIIRFLGGSTDVKMSDYFDTNASTIDCFTK